MDYKTREEQIQAALEAKNVRMRQLEVQYVRAKDFQKSLEWQTTRDRVLQKIAEVIAPYSGKDATEAVFKAGQIKQIMLEVFEATDIIVEFEGLKREIETYYAQRGE